MNKMLCIKDFIFEDKTVCFKDNYYDLVVKTPGGVFQIKDETNQNLYFADTKLFKLPYIWEFFSIKYLRKIKLEKLKESI